MLADIPQRSGTQHSIHHRMGQHICIRVAQQAFFKRHFHAAQDQLAAFHQTVHVITMSNAHFVFLFLFRAGQVLAGRDLIIGVIALRQLHGAAGQLEQAAVVGDKAGFFGIQLFQRSKVLCAVKALRGLHRIQGAAVGRCVHKAGIRHGLSVAARCSLDGILYRYGRCSCAAPGRCFQRCCDDGLTDEGSCRVVHCHKLPCCRQHAVFCALSAGGAARYDLHRLCAVCCLLLHKGAVLTGHQHDLRDKRVLFKRADAAVQHGLAAQIKAELVKAHACGRPRRHQYCGYSLFQFLHLPDSYSKPYFIIAYNFPNCNQYSTAKMPLCTQQRGTNLFLMEFTSGSARWQQPEHPSVPVLQPDPCPEW